jgi:homoserine dehydrogenase
MPIALADADAPAPLPPTRAAVSARTIRVGLLGLGHVGQAVARLAPDAGRLAERGLRVRIVGALVRNVDQRRRCVRPPRLTSNPAAFLRGHYDVVVEALGTIEPARAIVARLLGRGVPVVTANKALVAAHGADLARLATRRGTSFRYEASALAGVPFLGALAARPLVADVRQFSAVVNGTSNFILSTLETTRCAFDDALAEAQALGLTESDPSRDLDGHDAADKLQLLASVFGWGTASPAADDVRGIRGLTAADLHVARHLGARIKPIVHGRRTGRGFEAFVGPAVVAAEHQLAALHGTLTGIQLTGRFIPDLFFSGPGAGPDVTAATILDDVVETMTTVPAAAGPRRPPLPTVPVISPATRWFIRADFPGITPDADAVRAACAAHNLTVTHVTDAIDRSRWLCTAPAPAAQVTQALAALHATHRIQARSLRAL